MKRLAHTFWGVLLLLAGINACAADFADLNVPTGLSWSNYDQRGHELWDKGDYRAAIQYETAAIRLKPDLWPAYYNRGRSYFMLKNSPPAMNDFNATIRLNPAFFRGRYFRAMTYLLMRNPKAALMDINVLVEIATKEEDRYELAQALNERAWLRATCWDASLRNGQLAVADAKRACLLRDWRYSRYIDTLAAAYAETRDFDSAIRFEQRAIDLNKSGRDASLTQIDVLDTQGLLPDLRKDLQERLPDFVKRLGLYHRHQPYRE